MKQQSAISSQHSVVESSAEPELGDQKAPCHHERALAREGSAFWHFARTLNAVIREIFDENAYARFLARHRMTNTRESYALYLRESNLTRERRPRCC